ncbi:MAG: arginase [Bacillaceae bacterium]
MERSIHVLGVQMDLGQTRRGVNMGPSAIRYAGLVDKLVALGYDVSDLGDITTALHVEHEHNSQLKNINEVETICTLLAEKVENIVLEKAFPLVLGGDHSIAIGTIAGLGKQYNNLGLIWFDAHGDANTPETSPSGNIHGMPFAASLGYGDERLTNLHGYAPKIKAENVVMIGLRDLDEGEKVFLKKRGIKVYTMQEIDRLGMPKVMEETIAYLKDTDGVHLSLDLDGLDPIYAPGVGTPVRGGITYREGHLAMEMLYESGLITSAEFVEVNPILDEHNRTAAVAVELISSLLGKQLL